MTQLPQHLGVILIDHGSRQSAANQMLLDVVKVFKKTTDTTIVEPAHMELASPTLDEAFAACVKQGATEIVIHPYFLAPGRHSTQDIPRMAAQVAQRFPQTPYRVTDPLGVDSRIAEVILLRIQED
mgnify:CR=1 FL=1